MLSGKLALSLELGSVYLGDTHCKYIKLHPSTGRLPNTFLFNGAG
uniref:Uncharacterized protein n=1 Tax=Anguilla anguilla TaxID=7936 RepID=A0A0E9QBX1_ANGAN